MENIIGKAKSYLEEKGIDTSNMTMEEIIAKYQELIGEEEDLLEDVVEIEKDDVEESELDILLSENKDIIDSLTEDQKALFDKIIALIK